MQISKDTNKLSQSIHEKFMQGHEIHWFIKVGLLEKVCMFLMFKGQ